MKRILNRRSLVIAMLALIATASWVVYADPIGGEDPNQDMVPGGNGQGPGGEICNCLQVWQPVACHGTDNVRHCFSNMCAANCAGFTRCVSIKVEHC